jgi:hypothetical protein
MLAVNDIADVTIKVSTIGTSLFRAVLSKRAFSPLVLFNPDE